MDDMIYYLAEREAFSNPIKDDMDEITREFAQIKFTYLSNLPNEKEWELIPSKKRGSPVIYQKNIQLTGQIFEMQLEVSQNRTESMEVNVIIQSPDTYLPVGMQISVPDESDIYTETVINVSEKSISIPLELVPEQQFWVELKMGEASFREYFIA